MTEALAHRGPDGDGFYIDSHAALGHRRLAIIDRVGGTQPITNEDKTKWIVFNGEIYNHHDLRRQLVGKSHRFTTGSDTEVILHAYEQYGEDCVSRLEGMFAFAIYDSRTRTLFAARDRLGKKPFFFATFGGVLHFASEIKALERSPLWDGTWDPSNLEGYLSLGYAVAPDTIYRHIKQLEPGHWVRARGERVETAKYWDIEQFDTDNRDEPMLLNDLDELIQQSVGDRLESEVPMGAFLSGGIDSGLVASAMSRLMPNPIKTISVGFRHKDYSELDAAFGTARFLGTEHHSHVIEPDPRVELHRLVGAFDEPFADASAVPMYYAARIAKSHVGVALTGDGGDEAFSGYQARYVPHRIESYLRGLFGSAGRQFLSQVGGKWPQQAHLPPLLRAGSTLENLGRDPAAAYYADLCFLKPWDTRRLLGLADPARFDQSPLFDRVTAPYRRCPSASSLQRTQYADLKIYLPNDVLVKVDRMSMLNSLELRCPLLDRRLIEFAFRVPSASKMPWLRSKHLLRALARRRLSKDIATRPKRGFQVPLSPWLTQSKMALADDVLAPSSRVRSVIDQTELRRLYERHQYRRADASHALWATWVLEHWMRDREGRQSDASPRPAEHWVRVLSQSNLRVSSFAAPAGS